MPIIKGTLFGTLIYCHEKTKTCFLTDSPKGVGRWKPFYISCFFFSVDCIYRHKISEPSVVFHRLRDHRHRKLFPLGQPQWHESQSMWQGKKIIFSSEKRKNIVIRVFCSTCCTCSTLLVTVGVHARALTFSLTTVAPGCGPTYLQVPGINPQKMPALQDQRRPGMSGRVGYAGYFSGGIVLLHDLPKFAKTTKFL